MRCARILGELESGCAFVVIGPRAIRWTSMGQSPKKLGELKLRLSVRPGLTGLAQVPAKASRDNAMKLRHDLEY